MSVEPALSAPATVNIATLPVVMGYFTIKNCPSTSVAQTADFQTQFKVKVAFHTLPVLDSTTTFLAHYASPRHATPRCVSPVPI